MNQSEFLAFSCHLLKAREKKTGGFGFASHWLKNWREIFRSIANRSNRNHVITFGSFWFCRSLVEKLASHL